MNFNLRHSCWCCQHWKMEIYIIEFLPSRHLLSKVSLNLTIKTPERYHWRRSGVFFVNFEQISHHVILLFHCWPWTNKCRLGGFIWYRFSKYLDITQASFITLAIYHIKKNIELKSNLHSFHFFRNLRCSNHIINKMK